MSGHGLPFHILCVDDEVFLLDLCKLFLEKGGELQIDTASSAAEGLNKLKELLYDAIISDYEMPGMNGVEFLKTVRASGNMIPFIIFTGRGREEVVIEALNPRFFMQSGKNRQKQFLNRNGSNCFQYLTAWIRWFMFQTWSPMKSSM